MTDKHIAQYIAFKLKSWLEEAFEISCGDTNDDIWEKLYNKVFSENVSKRIFELFPDFHYCDTDVSYYEDVLAFINAFVEYSKKQRITIIASNISENMLRKYCDGYEIDRFKRMQSLKAEEVFSKPFKIEKITDPVSGMEFEVEYFKTDGGSHE